MPSSTQKVPKTRIYLDHNASAPLLAASKLAMIDALDQAGNGSSIHFEGRAARKMIESARTQVGDLVGAEAKQVIFTSGATEAAMQALSPKLRAGGREIEVSKLYVSAIEHPCILSGGRFEPEDVVQIAVLENGMVDLGNLESNLLAHDHSAGAPMIAVMAANNETGSIQPLQEVSRLANDYGAFLVVDSVQALGKGPFSIDNTGAHFVIISSHKIGGPQGVGALVLADPTITPLPLLKGGSQEYFQRAGTENAAGIAGFGAACQIGRASCRERV